MMNGAVQPLRTYAVMLVLLTLLAVFFWNGLPAWMSGQAWFPDSSGYAAAFITQSPKFVAAFVNTGPSYISYISAAQYKKAQNAQENRS
jgi:hypothetical protein